MAVEAEGKPEVVLELAVLRLCLVVLEVVLEVEAARARPLAVRMHLDLGLELEAPENLEHPRGSWGNPWTVLDARGTSVFLYRRPQASFQQ